MPSLASEGANPLNLPRRCASCPKRSRCTLPQPGQPFQEEQPYQPVCQDTGERPARIEPGSSHLDWDLTKNYQPNEGLWPSIRLFLADVQPPWTAAASSAPCHGCHPPSAGVNKDPKGRSLSSRCRCLNRSSYYWRISAEPGRAPLLPFRVVCSTAPSWSLPALLDTSKA